jgi:tetratricopeptide (TPR) repeat protein
MAFSRRCAALFLLLAAACSSESAKHKAAGNVLFKQGQLDRAIGEYRAAVAVAPEDANARTLLGNALFEKADWTGARLEYEAALALDGRARAALQGLTTLELRQRHPDAARALLTRLLMIEPRDAESQAALGKLEYQTGDLDGAERHLREALVYAQNDPAALYTLGLVLAKKRDQEQATAIFDRLDGVTPGKAYAPYGRAVAAAVSGRDDEALRWLSLALERGIDDLADVESDASFARLRSAPRFVELLAAARTRAPPRKGPGP